MRPSRFFTPIGVLLFFLLCMLPVDAQAPQQQPVNLTSGLPFQLGLSWTFTSTSTRTAGFRVPGIGNWKFLFVPSGTVSSCSLSLDSSQDGTTFSVGGVVSAGSIGSCASAGSFIASGTTPTVYAGLNPTITGSGSVTVVLFGYTEAAGGSAVSVSNFPATQNVNCVSGCPGANPNGQAAMASSAPVVIASNQSAVPVNSQPLGFGAVLSNQQAVTATAAALASNAVHSACVKALPANTIDVYVGPSGVTTSTGYDLAPGDWACYQVTNTNLLFVIASTTGASVSWTAN